jgi:hypothetical protein
MDSVAQLGLDERAVADMMAEIQLHQQRLSEIATTGTVGLPYVLHDEAARHNRNLSQIFVAAQKRAARRETMA